MLKLIIFLETTSSIHTDVTGYDDNDVNYNLCYSTGHPPSPLVRYCLFSNSDLTAKNIHFNPFRIDDLLNLLQLLEPLMKYYFIRSDYYYSLNI